MLCQRCGRREAELFLTQQQGDGFYSEEICGLCARRDQGLVLGALLQAQTPGASPLSLEQELAIRRALDRAAAPETPSDPPEGPA
jgi:protein-arginine kinase activator protein McsA